MRPNRLFPSSLAVSLALLGATTVSAQDPVFGEEFPREWFFHDDSQWEEHLPLLGQPMPTLDLSEWHNGELDLEADLRGKVVVVDFWATWCGPCIAAIPHNNELVEQFGDEGMVLIGVCGSSSGQDTMVSTADGNGVTYPVAKDASLVSGEAWKVMWWPTYGVVDRQGRLRALGLMPNHVDAVVEKLLAEPAPDGNAEKLPPVPEEWNEPRTTGRAKVDALVGRAAPAVTLGKTVGGEFPEAGLAALAGKVVLVHFFGPWNRRSREAVSRNRQLIERFDGDEFVVIGVCAPQASHEFDTFVKDLGVDYLAGIDAGGATRSAFRANSYPDDYVIDRQGRVRFADIRSEFVAQAVQRLLDEPRD